MGDEDNNFLSFSMVPVNLKGGANMRGLLLCSCQAVSTGPFFSGHAEGLGSTDCMAENQAERHQPKACHSITLWLAVYKERASSPLRIRLRKGQRLKPGSWTSLHDQRRPMSIRATGSSTGLQDTEAWSRISSFRIREKDFRLTACICFLLVFYSRWAVTGRLLDKKRNRLDSWLVRRWLQRRWACPSPLHLGNVQTLLRASAIQDFHKDTE